MRIYFFKQNLLYNLLQKLARERKDKLLCQEVYLLKYMIKIFQKL